MQYIAPYMERSGASGIDPYLYDELFLVLVLPALELLGEMLDTPGSLQASAFMRAAQLF